MFQCKHKYGEVKDGFQYCEKCGKAISAPAKVCSHNWVNVNTFTVGTVFNANISSYLYVMRCTNCGNMKKIDTNDL